MLTVPHLRSKRFSMVFLPVLPPYPHQGAARAKMRGRQVFALNMEMRTGKTKVIMDDFLEMEDEGEVKDLLYVSPGGALYGEDALETQVGQHMPPDVAQRARVGVWRSGAGQGARRELDRLLREADPRRPRVLLVNVEALSSVDRARELCRDFLQSSRDRHRGSVMVVGESTTIKGTSRRTEVAQDLGTLASYRRIETGLLTPHSPLDLFHQFYFLDPRILGQHSWFGYRARYAITKQVCLLPREQREALERSGRRLPKVTLVVGFRHEDELNERIEPHRFRVRLSECREAPPAVYRFRDVELTPEQRRMYSELKENCTTAIEGAGGAHATPLMKVTQVLRLHQLACGHMVDDAGGIHDVPERRTAAVLELLEECEGKAVIWCAYDHCVRKVIAAIRRAYRETLGEQCVAGFWGGNASTRVEEERRFKSDPRCRFMAATAAAGGRGREWSLASLMIYHSNTPNLEHRDQSEMRTEAVGKVDPVTRYDLRVRGTPDEMIIQNLRDKITMASTLQGDGYRDWLV